MVAARDLEVAPHIRVAALLCVLDPCAIDAKGYRVLRLARSRARMTSNAASIVDDKAVVHARPRWEWGVNVSQAEQIALLNACNPGSMVQSMHYSSRIHALLPMRDLADMKPGDLRRDLLAALSITLLAGFGFAAGAGSA